MEISTASNQQDEIPRRQVFITMAGIMLAIFISSLDQTIVAISMPHIVSDLGGFGHYTWITTAYIIASAVIIPITGKLTDMYGRKYFYIGGLLIFTIASFLCGISNSMMQIIISRGIQGMGAGVMMANSVTLIGDLFQPSERGKYQGLISSVFGLSSIIGPTLGGFITETYSWHWIFFINIPLGILIVAMIFLFFPHLHRDKVRHQIDYPGIITLILAVVPLLLSLSWGGVEYEWVSPQIICMLLITIIMLVIFVFVESRSPEPIIPLSLFRNQITRISFLVMFFISFGRFGMVMFVPLFFQGVLAMPVTTSGKFYTPMVLCVVFGSIISGQILSRTGGHYRLQGIIGLVILTVGLGLLASMTADISYVRAVVYIIIAGIGLGITIPIFPVVVQNAVPHSVLGVATSVTSFFRFIGGSVGLAIMGSVMNARFSSELNSRFTGTLGDLVPPEQLASFTSNPQALISSEAQAQLRTFFEQFGAEGPVIFEQVLRVLRESLNTAISEVFLVSLGVVIIALVFQFFIKEIPLRKHR